MTLTFKWFVVSSSCLVSPGGHTSVDGFPIDASGDVSHMAMGELCGEV